MPDRQKWVWGLRLSNRLALSERSKSIELLVCLSPPLTLLVCVYTIEPRELYMYAVRPTAASPLPAHNLIEIGGGLSTEVNALSLLFRVKKAGGGGGQKVITR